jgi:biopolymer transport protein ExbB/TolQ
VADSRWMWLGVGGLFGLVFVVLLHFVLPGTGTERESYMAAFLLDRGSDIYPLSIQNLMWVIFFMGLGDLWTRYQATRSAQEELLRRYLPEDEETVLMTGDLAVIYRRLRAEPGLAKREFLSRMIQKVILQFQISQSVEQSSVLLNSSLELFMHELELRYGLLRYLMWFIPTLGFIGTVLGISRALEFAASYGPDTGELLPELTAKLGVAFFTTLLALILSGVLVLLIHIVQGREERLLNEAGHYCLDHLINRLYVKK